MSTLRRFLLRMVTAFRTTRAEDEVAREMQVHLALMEEDLRARGMGAAEARVAATLAFGSVDRAKELQRDTRAFRWIDDARRDALYACRSLARTPRFAVVAVATLALGIAATTAVFTLFDAVLLKPLAVDRPDQLRVIRRSAKLRGLSMKASTSVPYDWFLQLRAAPEVFSEVMAFDVLSDAVMLADGRETSLSGGGVFVSDNYFPLLGVQAAIGRAFIPADRSASGREAVLSHRCWQRDFGGAPDVIGRRILINGASFTVAGVGPSTFLGLVLGAAPDVFLPLESLSDAQPANGVLADRANWTVQVVGRIEPGTPDVAAGERLTTLRDFMSPKALGEAKHVLELLPIETGLSDVRTRFARPLSLLLGMGALLLLIACANVATLLGARASSRRAEIVIRSAVGAGKGRLLRQLVTECLVMAGIAGILGALFGSWATRILMDWMPQESNPLRLDIAMDHRVLLFAGALSILTALLAGVMPALRALGFDLATALRDRSRGGVGGANRGRPFAIIQVALSVILVVASTMFARTVYNLTRVDLGFDPEQLIQVFVDPGSRLYRGPALEQYYRGTFDRLRSVPAVQSVTSSQMQLLERARTTGTVEVPGFVPQSVDESVAQVFQVGPDFFETTRMPLVRGRDFTAQDMDGVQRPVAINEVAARRFFRSEDPIGKTLRAGGTYQVIAIVRGAKYNSLREEEPAVIFVPYTSVRQRPRMIFLVRTSDQSEATLRTVMAAVRGEDPLIPLSAATMSTFVARNMAQEQFVAALSMVFASAALLLLSIGLYGIMSFWVAERTPEIGVHLALGAPVSQIRWVVIRQPLWLAGVGIAVGVPAVLLGAGVIDSLMFGVGPRDPVTIAAAVTLVLLVTIVASLSPAHRAARVDPMTALRCE
ncbi:MAG: ADOP family duplicated permease [Vicinamibacterales bacterium]